MTKSKWIQLRQHLMALETAGTTEGGSELGLKAAQTHLFRRFLRNRGVWAPWLPHHLTSSHGPLLTSLPSLSSST